MAKSGNRGIGLLIVAMIIAALAYRFWPRGSSTDKPIADAAIVAPPDAATARADATRAVVDEVEQPKPTASFQPGGWDIQAISTANNKALLYQPAKSVGETPGYRVVVIATVMTEAELMLPSMKFVGIDDPGPARTDAELIQAYATDHAKLWPLLREFPLGAGHRAASTPDGKHGAFNYGDHLYVVAADKPIKVPLPAAYDPVILADGKTLLFRGYDGEFDGPGTARYSLFSMPLAGGKPQKIAGTEGFGGSWALSRDGKFFRTVVGELPWVQTCVVEIPLVAPFRIGKKRCIDGDGSGQLSPHGERFLWSVILDDDVDSTIGRTRSVRQRLRVLELDRGNVPFDHMSGGTFLVTDSGRILLEDAETLYDIDGKTTREIELDRVTLDCRFLDDSSVVCPHGDSIKRFELSSLPAAR